MPMYVDEQGYLRMSDPNAEPPLSSMDRLQQVLAEHLTERGPQGPVKGQAEFGEFAIIHGERRKWDPPEKTRFNCYALTHEHRVMFTEQQMRDLCRKAGFAPFFLPINLTD